MQLHNEEWRSMQRGGDTPVGDKRAIREDAFRLLDDNAKVPPLLGHGLSDNIA